VPVCSPSNAKEPSSMSDVQTTDDVRICIETAVACSPLNEG